MLRHIGPPMLPTPMNPTFMASSPEKMRSAHYIRGMDPASPLLGRDADRAQARWTARRRSTSASSWRPPLLLVSTAVLFVVARHFEPMHWAWGYVAAFAVGRDGGRAGRLVRRGGAVPPAARPADPAHGHHPAQPRAHRRQSRHLHRDQFPRRPRRSSASWARSTSPSTWRPGWPTASAARRWPRS